MRRFLFILALPVALAACTASQTQSADKALIQACATYAQSLSVLADFKAKLTPAQVLRVNEINKYVDPFCLTPGLPTDPTTSLQYINGLVTELGTLALGVK